MDATSTDLDDISVLPLPHPSGAFFAKGLSLCVLYLLISRVCLVEPDECGKRVTARILAGEMALICIGSLSVGDGMGARATLSKLNMVVWV